MPIENIIKSQKQGKLFGYKLKEELNSNNKLYKLRELMNLVSPRRVVITKCSY